MVPESKDFDPSTCKKLGPTIVLESSFLRVMLPTVKFDRELRFVTVEVEHVRINWILSTKLGSGKTAIAED